MIRIWRIGRRWWLPYWCSLQRLVRHCKSCRTELTPSNRRGVGRFCDACRGARGLCASDDPKYVAHLDYLHKRYQGRKQAGAIPKRQPEDREGRILRSPQRRAPQVSKVRARPERRLSAWEAAVGILREKGLTSVKWGDTEVIQEVALRAGLTGGSVAIAGVLEALSRVPGTLVRGYAWGHTAAGRRRRIRIFWLPEHAPPGVRANYSRRRRNSADPFVGV
jgi:hypothetical protein